MGDRCYLTVEIRREDRDKFVELMDDDPSQEEEAAGPADMLRLEWEEVNYGAGSVLEQAAHDGLRFVAYNSVGCNYSEGITVGHGGEHAECAALEAVPVCEVGVDGEPDAHSLANVRYVIALMKKVHDNT